LGGVSEAWGGEQGERRPDDTPSWGCVGDGAVALVVRVEVSD
jgi:hypothetical protein